MTIDEMIAVLQAAKEGKAIQWRHRGTSDQDWWNAPGNLGWNFDLHEYRVRPKPREVFVTYRSDGTLWDCSATRQEAAAACDHPANKIVRFVEDLT